MYDTQSCSTAGTPKACYLAQPENLGVSMGTARVSMEVVFFNIGQMAMPAHTSGLPP